MTTFNRFSKAVSVAAFSFIGVGLAQAEEPKPTHEPSSEERAQPQKLGESTIYFEFDADVLDADAKAELDRVAAWAKANDDRTVVIAGHTDEVGTADYNFELGDRRAQAAANYLAEQGIDRTRIELRSYGEKRTTSSRDAKNRRVVFFATRGAVGAESTNLAAGADLDLETDGDFDVDAEADADFEADADLETHGHVVAEPDLDADADIDVDADVDVETPEYAMEPVVVDVDDEPDYLLTRHGMAVSVGGGVTGLIDSDANDFIDEGGAWEARLAYGTRSPLAVEAAYVGSAQDISALGLDDDTVLLGSGVEANLRLNLLDDEAVQPYVFGGAGWTHYDLVNDSFNTSNVRDSDDTIQLPLGAGLGFRAYGALIDFRGTVRPVFDDQLMDSATANADDAKLDNWGVTGKVGWEF